MLPVYETLMKPFCVHENTYNSITKADECSTFTLHPDNFPRNELNAHEIQMSLDASWFPLRVNFIKYALPFPIARERSQETFAEKTAYFSNCAFIFRFPKNYRL